LELSYFQYLKRTFCRIKSDHEQEQLKYDAYFLANRYITEKLDLSCYFKLIEQFSMIKVIFLAPYQHFMLDNMKKINLFNGDDKNYLELVHNSHGINLNDDVQLNHMVKVVELLKDDSDSIDIKDSVLIDSLNQNLKKIALKYVKDI
jgi:hypothetical protein